MSQAPKKTSFKFLGVTALRPDYKATLSAGLITTIFFLIVAMVLPPESGAHAAGRWASIFAAMMLNQMGVRFFDGLHSAVVSIATIVGSGIAGTILYVVASRMLGY